MIRPDPGDLNRRRLPTQDLLPFCGLYAIQGVVFAYFTNFNQGYMGAAGVDSTTVGLVMTLAMLPFAIKFLFGILSDRYSFFGLGHRKPYIIIGLLMQAIGLVLLTQFNPGTAIKTFGALAIVTVTGLALYDTCTDGLVVTSTPASDRDRVQGLLMFSRFLTAALCSTLFGFWLQRTGTGPGKGDGLLWTCAALTILPLIGVLLRPEPPRPPDAEQFQWSALRVMIRPQSLLLIAFGVFYAIVSWGVELNLPIYHEDTLGYGPGALGQFGSARTLGRAAGALLLPIGATTLGRLWTLRIAVIGLAVAEALQAVVGPGELRLAASLSFLFGLANGWTEALFYVMAMQAAEPRMAASTFALFMAVSNLSVLGQSLLAGLVSIFGVSFRVGFLGAGVITCLAFSVIRPLSRLGAESLSGESDD